MVKSAGATFCLVGHSERRHIFGESNEELAKKICAAVGSGLKVIYCVGETIDEHTRLKSVLTDQLSALKGCDLKCVIIAYEPVWAIGTGKVAKQADIIKAHKFIKEYINKTYGTEVRVLYGGSVNSENANEILSLDVVDGVLVGGASLDAIKFSNIVNVARKF